MAVREAVLGPGRLDPFGGAGSGGSGVFGHGRDDGGGDNRCPEGEQGRGGKSSRYLRSD